MALGAGSVTAAQMAEGYSVFFANTGYRVYSWYVQRITDSRGKIVAQMAAEVAGENAKRTLDARNAFVMTSMMQDVMRFGTGSKSRVLGRRDLAGKTGTTNDTRDAWFAGYTPDLVAVAWVGFDQPRSLGGSETGGAAALPIWINFMATALDGLPEKNNIQCPKAWWRKPCKPSAVIGQSIFYSEWTQTNPELGLGSGTAATQPLDEIKDLLF